MDQIGDKYCKFRSCSLGQGGLSASLLDLQDKKQKVNDNIDEIVTKSIKSMKTTFTHSEEFRSKTLSMSQISSCSVQSKNVINMNEMSKLKLIRQTSMASSIVSSGSGSESFEFLPKQIAKKPKDFGKLNPNLYRQMSNSTSSNSASFGDLHLSYVWMGADYDQLKIRILKMKNIPEEFYRAGLYIRY